MTDRTKELIKNQNTNIVIHIDKYKWSNKKLPTYTLKIDNVKVLETMQFDLIDKEVRKYFRLRFKENVR